MRLILFCLLLLASFTLLALPQYSQSECQKLNAQRLEVRKQLRQPYNADHGQQLQARQKELERLLKQHCKQPVKDPSVLQAVVEPSMPVQR
ncbi:hypothetical protein [Rheinheimera maricola]|uniref:DUF1090 family protein n=1 Tax=Rheinheimera maricola TaxID=2793282 RepID=A0ABS7X4F0_9GAMM|nr:hypothetical protein [Rheinheimera maricola]MBZ9610005.1 hypothetical protein [Rheinheimera maricola]